jgi:hypothetical protein
MEYYEQSTAPSYSPAFTGDGVSSQSTSSKVGVVQNPAKGSGVWAYSKGQGGGGGTIYTLQICLNGNPMNLDVYVAGNPY